MSKPFPRFTTNIASVLKSLETSLSDAGVNTPSKVIEGTFSMESNAEYKEQVGIQTQNLVATICESMSELDPDFADNGVSLESNENIHAGVIAALGSQRPASYHKQALAASRSGQLSLESIHSGLGGDIDVVDASKYSSESFDETELANYAAQNIVFNVMASRQDEFAEAFFPTKVVTAAEGGISITVDRQEVIEAAQHNVNGSALLENRRNLNDAFFDHTVLNRPSTILVPWVNPDNSADANFVPDAVVPSNTLVVGEHSVPTRPLLMGRKINLLGLSQHPGLLDNGTMDSTDQMAPGARLKAIYVSMTDGTDTEVVRIETGNMPRNQFKKSHEGSGREVALNFVTDSIIFDANVKTISGVASVLLKDAIVTPDLVVSVATSVSGNGNLATGSVEINGSSLRVERVTDASAQSISLTAGAGKAAAEIFDTLKATIVGYDLDARRSNSNWRSTGSLIDVTPYTETFAIELGYPISVLSPPDDSTVGNKINGMINAARIRNSNNAVTTLLNYAEQLEAVTEAMARGVKVDVLGAGRHIVRPFFKTEVLDIQERLVSITSNGRAEDVSRVLVDAIRDMGYRMYRDSNYGPALSLSNAGVDTKPILLIGCDEVVKRHLNIIADERLLGAHMDFRVVATNDERMTDKIFLSFTRERPASEDALSFGVHAYVPELIQRLNVSRGNGATAKNDRVIPRSIHVPVLPVVARLDVVKLREALLNETV